MKSAHSNSSLAVAAAGLFGFVVLISGVWHPKLPAGGLTQVGRTASVTFEDGTVMDLTESATDQDTLKKRRMRGWNGHDYKQTFIMADGEEVDMADYQPVFEASGDDLSTGDHLMLAANTTDAPEGALVDGKRHSAILADLQTDGKAREVASEVDGKDSLSADLIDGKDRVYTDPKDAKDITQQPVFALTADQSLLNDERLDMILMGGGMGGGSDFGSPRIAFGLGDPGTGNGVSVSTPPIGIAVPEPSALLWIGVVGALGLAFKAWRRRTVAA